MSEPKCPGCGVEWDHGTQPTNVWIMYKCDAVYREGVLYRVSKACLLRQLVQRDERIKELEGERDQLRADIATVAPVVRAAMEQEDHHSDAARHYPHDPRDLCACGVCVQVRSLPAAVLERMGVDR